MLFFTVGLEGEGFIILASCLPICASVKRVGKPFNNKLLFMKENSVCKDTYEEHILKALYARVETKLRLYWIGTAELNFVINPVNVGG